LTSFGLREIDSFFFSSGGEKSGSSGGSGGGGQPLQTFVMLEEDRLTDDLARSLCRYWCGEGVAQGQVVVVPAFASSVEVSLSCLDSAVTADGSICELDVTDGSEGSSREELNDFAMSLPRNLHLDKFRAKMAAQSQSTTQEDDANNNRESFAIIEEGSEDDEDEGGDSTKKNSTSESNEGLVNAWQYRKSVQDARSGMRLKTNNNTCSSDLGSVYCHSFDLSRRMWDQFASNDNAVDGDGMHVDRPSAYNPLVRNIRIVDCSSSSSTTATTTTQGMKLFQSLWKHIQATFSIHPTTVIRLFLHRLPVGAGSVALPLLMAKIRKENLPVVVLATIRPWRWLSASSAHSNSNVNKLDTLSSLRTTADTTLSLDSFLSLRTPPPPEFSLLSGILTVRKCAPFTSVSHYTDTVNWKQRPLAERFGVKRDARKVTVQLLHLPPEEYSKGGSSTSGVRSGGGNSGGGNDDGCVKKTDSTEGGGCSTAKHLGSNASLDF
jgi:hypothetical protein